MIDDKLLDLIIRLVALYFKYLYRIKYINHIAFFQIETPIFIIISYQDKNINVTFYDVYSFEI